MAGQQVIPDLVNTGKQEKEVVVELDQNNQPVKPIDKKQEEPKYVRYEELEKERQRIAYAIRKEAEAEIRKIKQELEELKKPKETIPQIAADEWDAKLQKDWKSTVRELARQEAEEIKRQAELQYQSQIQKQKNDQLSFDNQKKVMDRHPELNDETSTKYIMYRQIVTEHPEYLSNPFGPVLAMRDMEDKLREQGIADEPTKKIVEKEVIRQTRAGAGAMPKGTPASGNQRVVLTKEQKQFCDQHGIKYENYAKYSRNQSVEANT